MLALTCTGGASWAQGIDLQPEATFFSGTDVVGFFEQEFDATFPVGASFSVGSVAVDLDTSVDVVSSRMRLDTLPSLHAAVDSLPASALRDALNQSLASADAAIDAIRAGNEMSIDALYSQLKIIEGALDDNFIDLVDDSPDIAPMAKARLLIIAKPIEQRYDYLKYIANKVRLYARDEVKAGFAGLLCQAIVAVADGDDTAYRTRLVGILTRVAECRGTTIKQEEADRIRYKSDLLLRKIAENGVNRACAVDLSTTLADVDVDGAFSWDRADYRAPSKDVRTDGLDLTASYAGDDWDASIDYQQEWRDYADWLKDDSDRMRYSLDISVAYDVDPYSADIAPSFDHEFYPNDIDAEIELKRVAQARAAITDLVARVRGLPLSATLKDRLIEDLGEDGAVGALAIGDRSEAVDCLQDFMGHVLDAQWSSDIAPDIAQALIDAARAILPRRRIYNIDIPLSLGFPFRGSDMTLDIEWESKTYPADSPLDHDTVTGKLGYTRNEPALTLSGYIKREELAYPHATTKNRSLREWAGSLDKELACGDLALTLFQQQTTYPQAVKKDQSVHKLDLDLSIDLADVSIVLQWTDKVTEHVNDASKPIVQVTEMGLAAGWDFTQGILHVSLSDEQEWNAGHDVSLAEKILSEETRQGGISWAGEITDDLDLTISLTWKNVVDLADPSKDRDDITLQIECDLAL